MCIKLGKLVILSDNYHDIGRLLPVTIIVDSKNWTISIIITENITVNRQNRLIAHPYSASDDKVNITHLANMVAIKSETANDFKTSSKPVL